MVGRESGPSCQVRDAGDGFGDDNGGSFCIRMLEKLGGKRWCRRKRGGWRPKGEARRREMVSKKEGWLETKGRSSKEVSRREGWSETKGRSSKEREAQRREG